MRAVAIFFLLLGSASAVRVKDAGSPVQKVIELLDDMKGKIKSDLAAESQGMEEYLKFCDDETKEKGFAMKTADSQMADLQAVIEESKATIVAKGDAVGELGSHISAKEKELDEARKVREAQNADFVAAEKELETSAGECARAAAALAKGLSFAQVGGKRRASMKKEFKLVQNALSAILSAAWIDAESSHKLKSFLQQSENAGDSDDLSLHLRQPQGKQVAYESKSGVIVDMIKDMQKKAEAELSALRKKEMETSHEFKMLEASLVSEIEHSKEAVASATEAKSAAVEAQGKAEGELTAIQKTKAADVEYTGTLKTDCETKANEWEAREKSASGEMAALDKAKEILASGVKALVQVKVKTHRQSEDDLDGDDAQDLRDELSKKLAKVGRRVHSFALMSLASAARSDPFVKIRGLIEEMIAKLLKQAEEEATQKAFCDTEMGKSKKSQADKEAKLDKFAARIDKAETSKTELEDAIKALESEVADIDKAQAEATKIRTQESADNLKAMKDFKDSADAVIAAIGVLKSFYEGGAFIQMSSRTRRAGQPEFGAAKSDAGGSIISVLEVAESDFTRLYAEVDTEENEAAEAYTALTTENKVSKATKEAEAKGKASELKSLGVALTQSQEDHASTSEELDAVLDYLAKLKPQCETKAMSYEEKVAKRNAEIEGLKDALNILSGEGVAMLQGNFRRH